MKDLAEPVHVKLPIDVMERLRKESNRDGIPISALVRRAVLREFRLGESDGNPDNTTGNPAVPANNVSASEVSA